MRTADNYQIHVGDVVFTRVGGCYPTPGRWRVREMRIASIGHTRLRLEAVKPGRTGCFRTPDEVYRSPDVARGIRPNGSDRTEADPEA